jgi:hypothetical protein
MNEMRPVRGRPSPWSVLNQSNSVSNPFLANSNLWKIRPCRFPIPLLRDKSLEKGARICDCKRWWWRV